MLIIGPILESYRTIVDALECLGSECLAFGNDFDVHEVLDTHRLLAFGKLEKLLDKLFQEGILLVLIFLLENWHHSLLCPATIAVLIGTAIKCCVDNDTMERRIGLKRSILDITSLVAEDGAK